MTNKFKSRIAYRSTSHAEFVSKLSMFNRWDHASTSRRRFVLLIGFLALLAVLGQALAEKKLKLTATLAVSILCFLFSIFKKLRDHQLVWKIFMGATFGFLVTKRVATSTWLSDSSHVIAPFKQYDYPNGFGKWIFLMAQLEAIPPMYMATMSKIGFPSTASITSGIILAILSVVNTIQMTHDKSHSNLETQFSIAVWCVVPSIFLALFIHDNDEYLQRCRQLVEDGTSSALKEREQQKQWYENQQRIVGYIFHEVRNPINNISLASELALDLLSRCHRLSFVSADHAAATITPSTLRAGSTPTIPHLPLPTMPLSLPFQHTISPLSPLSPTASLSLQVPPALSQASLGIAPNSPKVTFNSPQPKLTRSHTASSDTMTVSTSPTTLRVSSPVNHCSLSSTTSMASLPLFVEVSELVTDIHHSTLAAARVLNDALNLQKLQSGAFEFVHKPFLLSDLVKYTTRMVQPQIKHKQIQLSCAVDEPLKHVTVIGDFHRLQQVLVNYLNNAYKFTPQEGEVKITVKQIGQLTKNDKGVEEVRVRTSVYNTGQGIKAEDRAKIFQPWSQLRAGEQQEERGSGLGLALCKAFVENGHGGEIGFESEVNKGTDFFFEIQFKIDSANNTIPTRKSSLQANKKTMPPRMTANYRLDHAMKHNIAKHRNNSENDDDLASPSIAAGNNGVHALSRESSNDVALNIDHDIPSKSTGDENGGASDTDGNHTAGADRVGVAAMAESPSVVPRLPHAEVDVLIVEDSVVTRKLLGRTLTSFGITFEQCVDGLQALNFVREKGIHYYSAIIMDKEMPKMDGFEATRKIREIGFVGPIIGCTGNAMDDQVSEFLQVGATHVLGKPITHATLGSTLEHVGFRIRHFSTHTPTPAL